jgi:hypothetical protein
MRGKQFLAGMAKCVDKVRKEAGVFGELAGKRGIAFFLACNSRLADCASYFFIMLCSIDLAMLRCSSTALMVLSA